MTQTAYFSCNNCKHSTKAAQPNWSRCRHPVVEELQFENQELQKYTDADYRRLEYLVNDVFHLQVITVKGQTPNFEFPFQFESTWITACNGFEQVVKRDIEDYIWNSGENK